MDKWLKQGTWKINATVDNNWEAEMAITMSYDEESLFKKN